MPTYEYECSKCGHRLEKFHSMSAKPLKTCPKCSGKMDRLIGMGSGIIFRGSGFYETDYKRKKSDSKEKKPCQGPNTDACKGCSLKPDAGT